MRSRLNACESVEYAREKSNNRRYLPDRRILVVIVKEKYAVIKVVATWNMLAPGRTLEETMTTRMPTTRIKMCQRWACFNLSRRTCVRNYKDDRRDDELEASSIYNVHPPYLSRSSGESKKCICSHSQLQRPPLPSEGTSKPF